MTKPLRLDELTQEHLSKQVDSFIVEKNHARINNCKYRLDVYVAQGTGEVYACFGELGEFSPEQMTPEYRVAVHKTENLMNRLSAVPTRYDLMLGNEAAQEYLAATGRKISCLKESDIWQRIGEVEELMPRFGDVVEHYLKTE